MDEKKTIIDKFWTADLKDKYFNNPELVEDICRKLENDYLETWKALMIIPVLIERAYEDIEFFKQKIEEHKDDSRIVWDLEANISQLKLSIINNETNLRRSTYDRELAEKTMDFYLNLKQIYNSKQS